MWKDYEAILREDLKANQFCFAYTVKRNSPFLARSFLFNFKNEIPGKLT